MDYYAALSHDIIEKSTTAPKGITPSNIKSLGFPFGLSKYGEHLKDRGVEIDVSAPNYIGKTRVKFTLPCRVIVTDGAKVVSLRKGEYDFLVRKEAEDWSGWFND